MKISCPLSQPPVRFRTATTNSHALRSKQLFIPTEADRHEVLKDLELTDIEEIILVDARNDNKPSASVA